MHPCEDPAMMRSRSHVSWRAPSSPAQFRHHVLLRDVDPRLFDAVVRHLRQRLYHGRVRVAGSDRVGVRVATLRQGAPEWLAPAVLVLGAAALFGFRPDHRALLVAAAGAILLCAVAIASAPRKYAWVVAYACAGDPLIDVWIAAERAAGADRFASEFATLIAETEAMQAAFAAAPATPLIVEA
jgi:hypothetical protein